MTETQQTGSILDINGPIVTIELSGIKSGEQVRIGEIGLIGEVISLAGRQAVVQTYESTDGVRPGEPAVGLGWPLSVELGPGLMGGIFDGVQRPLEKIALQSGDYVRRGLTAPALDRARQWEFEPNPSLQPGQQISGGAVIGTVQETATVLHRILVPPNVSGELEEVAPAGMYDIEAIIAHVRDQRGQSQRLSLYHRWPVRKPRPYLRRDDGISPLITGQRVIDSFFPQLKGGKGAVPGPFGAGKTVVQQQIARWSNADIVIYVGCGERGNELVDDARHYPSIDWVTSFSGHVHMAAEWWHEQIDRHWEERRTQALALLARDAELSRIVNLVGPEALSDAQRWQLEGATLIKEGVLQQSALDDVDTFCSPQKQFALLDLALSIYDKGMALIELGVPVTELQTMPELAKVRRCKSL
jgi:vacuolar-type H+-ATPase catalytic subunit A/Vma1